MVAALERALGSAPAPTTESTRPLPPAAPPRRPAAAALASGSGDRPPPQARRRPARRPRRAGAARRRGRRAARGRRRRSPAGRPGQSADRGGAPRRAARAARARGHADGDGRADAGGHRGADRGADHGAHQEATPEPTQEPDTAAAPDLDRASQLQVQGFNARQAGNFEQALALNQQALEACGDAQQLSPCGYALFEVGAALNALGRPQEAIPVLEQRLEVYGDNGSGEVKRELRAAQKAARD